MVKTTDFPCGTEPDRINQLPSTFMELVGLLGHHRWCLKEEMFVKKKKKNRIIPWIVLPYTHACDSLLAPDYTRMFLLNWRNIQWPGSTMWKQAWLLFTAWCKWLTYSNLFAASTLRWRAIVHELKRSVWLNSGYLLTQSFELLVPVQLPPPWAVKGFFLPSALLMSEPCVLSKAMLDTWNAGWSVFLVPLN